MCTIPIGGKNPKPNFCINPYSLSMKIKPDNILVNVM